MFSKETYQNRRTKLAEIVGNGLLLFPGNDWVPYNYPANPFHFRQDSSFLYYFGLNQAGLFGIVDASEGKSYLFGNDVDMDDIIWMGPQTSIRERGESAGVSGTAPLSELSAFIRNAKNAGKTIHFLPSYRQKNTILLSELLGIHYGEINASASEKLIKAVVKMRSIKEPQEIVEIEKAMEIAYEMHTTSMKMARPGIVEQEIAGHIEGIALKRGNGVSFPIILSVHGETLHNHGHANVMQDGDLMITDAGAETNMNYCSDITRTIPVNGKFSQRQKEIYEIVVDANIATIEATAPGVRNLDLHLMAAKIITIGLQDLGLMKGDVDAAVEAGAHALFFPHGLGHMMGLDVHDLEGLGEDYVGYDEKTKRSSQFGRAFLRLGKELEAGNVFTIEPGIYFIPELIDQWKSQGLHKEFINYDLVETYKDFGGIRVEDDILVTDTGFRVLGQAIPKTVAEIEAMMQQNA
jgi:Xaa-Pro aminopeptidase